MAETTRKDFDETLEQVRKSYRTECQVFAATLDHYLATGDLKANPVQPCPGGDLWMSILGTKTANLYRRDELALKMATLALMTLKDNPCDHPFIESFILRAIILDAQNIVSPFIDFAQSLGFTAEQLATRIAGHCYPLEFGWTITRLGAAAAGMTEQEYTYALRRGDRITGERTPPPVLKSHLPLEKLFLDLDDATLSHTLIEGERWRPARLKLSGPMTGTLALHRPKAIEAWLKLAATRDIASPEAWQHILKATDRWDAEFMAAMPVQSPHARLRLLLFHRTTGRPENLAAIRDAATDPGQGHISEALTFLEEIDKETYERTFVEAITQGRMLTYLPYAAVFETAARQWEGPGRRIFACISGLPFLELEHGSMKHGYFVNMASGALSGMLAAGEAVPGEEVRQWFRGVLEHAAITAKDASEKTYAATRLWTALAESPTQAVFPELAGALGLSAKSLRELAISGLLKFPGETVLAAVLPKLASRKADERLGAAEMLAHVKGSAAESAITQALATETADKVRAALHAALAAQGGAAPEEQAASSSPEQIEADCKKNAKKWKLPGGKWLDVSTLPPLRWINGNPVDSTVTAFLLSKQAAFKNLAPSPDILPVREHLDPKSSAPFAAALVEGFLASEQAASERWALALGGALGDSQIIPPLLSRIPDWCENARHKLAEYAAQAISLLPGNEPLMVLDTLANRYRSKFKNVGKACSEAFMAAAQARGITTDELGDMVVPSFEFDGDGVRRFEWDGGGASTELGPDFKLSWFDPDTDKSWKTLPAAAPESVKTEVKTLTKMLREAVKAQTPRLEMAMVRQRRWTPERWRELYENHPLLRSFASRLVWGIYDASGSMIRSFRRYPNGILANAEGGMEELADSEVVLGIAHPLEMTQEALQAWRAHLGRFKIAQPFPQIDRPVETRDPLHGNRREITLTNGKTVSAGSLRSRGEKRGWVRGSVVDAGSVSSYYKPYPGAGIEVILPTSGLWVGCDPMEEVQLESAYFVKSDTVDRGSYVYGEPGPDDPAVLRFDAVPPVVWSETVSDLKAILGVSS